MLKFRKSILYIIASEYSYGLPITSNQQIAKPLQQTSYSYDHFVFLCIIAVVVVEFNPSVMTPLGIQAPKSKVSSAPAEQTGNAVVTPELKKDHQIQNGSSASVKTQQASDVSCTEKDRTANLCQ